MPYTNQAAIEAKVPANILNDALDDDGDGQRDPGLLDQIIANASMMVDGWIGSRVDVPMAEPTAAVQSAALWFTIREIYGRRQRDLPRDWAEAITQVEEWLRGIAEGTSEDSSISGITAAAGTNPKVPGRLPGGGQTTY